MSAKRYRMALEAILILSPYSDGSAMQKIARTALDGAGAVPAAPVGVVPIAPVSRVVTIVTAPSVTAPNGQGADDDEPPEIDLAAIDAELDAEAARRADVLACISEGNGLNEQEIAAQLGMDREHVAIATGDLLADRKVVLRPDGTYVGAAESEAT